MNFILRTAVALVWFYQGLYLKVIARDPIHLKIVSDILGESRGPILLTLIGVGETLLGLGILVNIRTRELALFQILLLLAMNLTAIFSGSIPNPVGLLIGNAPFLACLMVLAIQAHDSKTRDAIPIR